MFFCLNILRYIRKTVTLPRSLPQNN
uniref:Uncharacterized protein n=1 Tax=Anguilla anguilla TaxID=7936 RepID=A0A0E9STM8_ANGAN